MQWFLDLPINIFLAIQIEEQFSFELFFVILIISIVNAVSVFHMLAIFLIKKKFFLGQALTKKDK